MFYELLAHYRNNNTDTMATAVAPPVNGHVDAPSEDKTDPSSFPVTHDNINACVRDAQYAVRGEIVIRANELAEKLRHGEHLGFEKTLACNIGNPHVLGQKPMTFIRQVLALCDYPQVSQVYNVRVRFNTHTQLMDDPKTAAHFPADAVDRAKELLADFPGGTGGYTDSRGSRVCRQMVVAGIEARDGYPADPDDIWLTDGGCLDVASEMLVPHVSWKKSVIVITIII